MFFIMNTAHHDDGNPGKMLEILCKMEEAAEDILSDKQQIIDLDRKRQKTREAIRVISKDKESNKQWICFGNMFIKFPTAKAKNMLDKDFDKIDSEISGIRNKLKSKVNKLRDLEMKDDLKGFGLNPLTKEELSTVEGFCH